MSELGPPRNNPQAPFDIGGMSIDLGVLDWFVDHLTPGARILELGSGEGTGALLEAGFHVTSIEEDADWVGKYHDRYLHAPLVGGWYDPALVRGFLEGRSYDAFLLDGPHARGRREGILPHLELFDLSVPWMIDDAYTEYSQPKVPNGKRNRHWKIVQTVAQRMGLDMGALEHIKQGIKYAVVLDPRPDDVP